MWLPSRETLASGDANERSLFVLQAWHELLDPTIPDSFRARVLDVFLLLDELDHVVALARDDSRWIAHVNAICEEIKEEQGDFLRMAGDTVDVAAGVAAIVEFPAGGVSLSQLAERVTVVRSLAGDRNRLLIAYLMDAAQDPANKKKDLLFRLGIVATHVQRLGLSTESVQAVSEKNLVKAPAELAETLCDPLLQKPREYSCFVAVRGSTKDATRIFHGSDMTRIPRKRLSSSDKALEWYEKNRDHYIVEVQTLAMSDRQAAEQALSLVNTRLNLVALYANGVTLSPSPSVLAQNDTFSEVGVVASKHFGLKPRNNSVALARSRAVGLSGRLGGRLSNILETHALGISSDDPRSAAINLWTALEAIAGTDPIIKNVGERVAAAVAPTVAWRRVDKIVTYLAINMVGVSRVTGYDFQVAHLPNSKPRHVDRADLLACLAGPKDNAGVLAVLADCAKSPLLKYQMYAAWQTFSSSRALRSSILRSEKRVRWQLLRLYRARNLLVHRGEMSELVWRLLDNAQYYVSTVMGRVLHNMELHDTWSVDTAIEYQRQRFAGVVKRLADAPSSITYGDLLVHEDLRRDEPVWPVLDDSVPA